MDPIELEHWEPDPADSRYSRHVSQPRAEEVFLELKQRLDSMGMLPDEYFLMAREWENGREIPRGADIFVTTDYGESEGVYLDAYLKWYEDGVPVTKSFFTGKTLGETGADLDRMFLISATITKAFHGDRGQYARFANLDPKEKNWDLTVTLSPAEHRLFIDALMEHREKMVERTVEAERLLRRMTGSITAYMDLVGERPLKISDYDRAVLAIRDGELHAFKNLLPHVGDRQGELLVEAAGRCGEVGRKMCVELLACAEAYSDADYTEASLKAVETNDTRRMSFLLEQAENKVPDLDAAYYGKVIDRAYLCDRTMGRELIKSAPDEWIASAPPDLLEHTILQPNVDFQAADMLVKKGAPCGEQAWMLFHHMTGSRDEWAACALLQDGLKVETDDYAVLDACVKNRALDTARTLLDQGMDFDGYLEWTSDHPDADRTEEALEMLQEHWNSIRAFSQERSGTEMEMSL